MFDRVCLFILFSFFDSRSIVDMFECFFTRKHPPARLAARICERRLAAPFAVRFFYRSFFISFYFYRLNLEYLAWQRNHEVRNLLFEHSTRFWGKWQKIKT